MSKTIVININNDKPSNSKSPSKQQTDKKAQAVKQSKDKLKYHSKEMFTTGSGFLKHFFMTLFYLLRLLGFALKGYGKAYNKKHMSGEKKEGEELIKW